MRFRIVAAMLAAATFAPALATANSASATPSSPSPAGATFYNPLAPAAATPGAAAAGTPSVAPIVTVTSENQPPPGVPPILTPPPPPPGWKPPAPTESASPSSTTAAAYACTVTATSLSVMPGGAYGSAYGTGKLYCGPPVVSTELWVGLESYWTSTNSWHLESTGDIEFGAIGTIYADDSFPCNLPAARNWAVVATAYATGSAGTFGASAAKYQTITCVG